MTRVAVVGAGHNGLACAWALARAGCRVTVLEAADAVGGATRNREFVPGHRVPGCAHLLRTLPTATVRAMGLERHGLRWAATRLPTHALRAGGAPLRVDRPADARDAAFRARLAGHAALLAEVMETTPPALSAASWPDRLALLGLGWKLRRRGRGPMRDLLRIIGSNVYDLLNDELDDAALKGALAFDAVLGAEHGPRAAGTVLTWLLRLAGEARAGDIGLALPHGGPAAVAEAMAAAVRSAGGTIRTGAAVAAIEVEHDRACGVRLADGERIAADVVVSNADPRRTLLGLVGSAHLDIGCVRSLRHYRASGRIAKLHLALDGLPPFRGLDAAALAGRLLVSPTMDALERACNPAKYGEIPAHPALEITLPTLHDSSLAPAGRQVMSVLAMSVPERPAEGLEAARARLQGHVLATLESHAPGLGRQLRACEVLLPADLEREYALPGGHWHHGALTLDQFLFNRPLAGASRYRAPVPGLYLCGAGSHPGGDIAAVAGLNAARELLADRARAPAATAAPLPEASPA